MTISQMVALALTVTPEKPIVFAGSRTRLTVSLVEGHFGYVFCTRLERKGMVRLRTERRTIVVKDAVKDFRQEWSLEERRNLHVEEKEPNLYVFS